MPQNAVFSYHLINATININGSVIKSSNSEKIITDNHQ